MVYSKKIINVSFSLTALTALFLLFQNFTPLGTLVSDMNPDMGAVLATNSGYVYRDQKKNRDHEVKIEGGGIAPVIQYYRRYDRNFIRFSTAGNSEHKDRSEIRIVGSDSEFDEVFYSSFELYYPSTSAAIDEKQWGILWQCAQAGDYGAPRSPPLNIQFRNNNFSVVTSHNFDRRSRILRKEIPLGPIQRDAPIKFFMRYRLGENGSVKVFINGKVVLEQRMPIGYDDGINPITNKKSCSVRFGIYKQANPDPLVLLFGNVKVGTDYSLVKP